MTNTNITSVGTLSTINATVSGVLNPGSIASSAVNFEISCNGGTIHSNSIYNSVTSTGASVSITGTNGYLQRSSSSMKYKLNIEDLDDNISSKIYDFRAVWYRSDTTKCTMDNPLWSFIGFIAEEIALIEPRLASYEKLEDGTYEPEGVQYDRIVPLIVKELKKLRDNTSTQIQELSEKNIELETSYSNLQTINNNLQSQINSMQSQINTILTTLSL
jgi:FtsZ-binding cell division protein ZapB